MFKLPRIMPLTARLARCGFGLAGALRETPEVDLNQLLGNGHRVIEFTGEEIRFGRLLRERKDFRYLALVPAADQEQIERLKRHHPELGERIQSCTSLAQVGRNNANVLIFSRPVPGLLASSNNFRRADYLVWPVEWSADSWRTTAMALKCVASGTLQLLGSTRWRDDSGTSRKYLVARVLVARKPRARHYVSPVTGIESFFRSLEERGVRYTILRWFDSLDALPTGEDIDLLVADEDVPELERAFGEQPGLTPADVYSVSGLPGTEYASMAYYPPEIARQILDRSVLNRNSIRVPGPEDHFLSLAYHAVYHKGERSGIPTELAGVTPTATPEHDYRAELLELARSLDLDVTITMEGLDRYLASRGWQPPLDTLGRLARHNRWLRQRLAELDRRDAGDYEGLAVFFLRQAALERGYQERILADIAGEGFQIITQKQFDEGETASIQHRIRGGNWGQGPFPRSGGPPAMVVVAYDPEPVPPGQAQLAKYPGLSNARILVKQRIRDTINDLLEDSQRCNVLHSSDNNREAREYLQIALPDEVEQVLKRVGQFRELATESRLVLS